MITSTIFVIDDEQDIREGISLSLSSLYRVETFECAEDALVSMAENQPDLVLLDVGLPGMDGLRALEEIRRLNPEILVVMITAYEDSRTVIQAMKLGAYDYVIKPIMMDSLEVIIARALDSVRLRKEVRLLQEHLLKERLPCFIARSKAIQDVMEFIFRVARSPDTPVLILGETGTGKELIASAIHYRSPNFMGPLVAVNCAAIPRELIESELFGYERGAFSGANPAGKPGLIEEAGGGTLFLDEVGDLSLPAQAKLMRFLEDGCFYRLGSTKMQQVKTRIVSATNKDLTAMMEEGLFRRDLYFRLGVITVQIPSLNERKEDILPLARYFLVEFGRKFGRDLTGITPGAERALLAHRWTGNVRELKNLLERAVLVGEGPELTAADLGIPEAPCPLCPDLRLPPLPEGGMDFPALARAFERHYIQQALERTGGNESEAARLLNMNHHTLRYRRRRIEGQRASKEPH
ncbi:MAG: sigma-54 dependent transcriptional regulator [Desulfomonilia bacterium]|jgi:two-component system response regulator AtoC